MKAIFNDNNTVTISKADFIKYFCNEEKVPAVNEDLYEAVTRQLLNIGMPIGNSGFKYCRDAIVMIAKDKKGKTLNHFIQEVYNPIAKKHYTTPSRVERAMRHAIDTSYAKDSKKFNKICGLSSLDTKPTNRNFIAAFAENMLLKGFE